MMTSVFHLPPPTSPSHDELLALFEALRGKEAATSQGTGTGPEEDGYGGTRGSGRDLGKR
jgi:hypothetical protein